MLLGKGFTKAQARLQIGTVVLVAGAIELKVALTICLCRSVSSSEIDLRSTNLKNVERWYVVVSMHGYCL